VSLSEHIETLSRGNADESARIESIREIVKLAPPGEPGSIAALRQACADPSPAVSFHARRALDHLSHARGAVAHAREVSDAAGHQPEELDLERFEAHLTHPDDRDVRIRAVTLAIERGCRAALPLLLARLEAERDEFVLSKLTKGIGLLGDRHVVSRLAPFLEHSDSRVRANTVEGLAAITDEQVFKLLVNCLNDSDNRVRANAVKALKSCRDFDPIRVLADMTRSDRTGDRASALFVLARMNNPRAIEAVLRLLTDEDPPTAEGAWEVVRQRGYLLGRALLDALEALSGRAPALRAKVLSALESLEERCAEELVERIADLRDQLGEPDRTAAPAVPPPPPVEPGSGVGARPDVADRAGPGGAAPTAPPRPPGALGQIADEEATPAGIPFVGIDTEFDTLGEAELRARLDEVEKGAEALATLERAARSKERTVRREARRRIPRARREKEARDRRDLEGIQRRRALALGAVAVVLLGVLGSALAPVARSLFVRPSPAPSAPAPEEPSAVPLPAPVPGGAAHVPATPPAPRPGSAPVAPVERPRDEGSRLATVAGLVHWGLHPSGSLAVLTREVSVPVYPSPMPPRPPDAREDWTPRPIGVVKRRDVSVLDTESCRETPVTSTGRADAGLFFGDGIAWIEGVRGSGDLWVSDSLGPRPLTQGILLSAPVLSARAPLACAQVNVLDAAGSVKGSDLALLDLSAPGRITARDIVEAYTSRFLTTSATAHAPFLDPTGARVCYQSRQSSGPSTSTALHVLEIATGQDRSVALRGEVLRGAWVSASGATGRGGGASGAAAADRLVVLLRRGGVTELVSIDPGNPAAPARQLLERRGSQSVTDFAVDPGGTRLAVVIAPVPPAAAGPHVPGDVWLAASDGVLGRRISSGRGSRHPALTGAGDVLYFVRDEDGEPALWRVPLGPAQAAAPKAPWARPAPRSSAAASPAPPSPRAPAPRGPGSPY
jgi:HEAT repeat protein